MQQRASGVTYLRADKRRDDVNPSGDARSRRGRAEVEAATTVQSLLVRLHACGGGGGGGGVRGFARALLPRGTMRR